MNKEQFFDWLTGYFDICEPDRIGIVETQIIKDHIDLVRRVEITSTTKRQSSKTQLSTDLLNHNLESLSSEIKKSRGGRGRPTIPSPPPPPIEGPKIKDEIELSDIPPLSSRTIC